jgi:geranylgeranyl pyrophosphate synthase
VVGEAIALIERCGALDGCMTDARQLVEDAWIALSPLVEDSLAKVMLRAFGWYVLERHY